MQSKSRSELFYFLATNHFRKALVRHTELNTKTSKKLLKIFGFWFYLGVSREWGGKREIWACFGAHCVYTKLICSTWMPRQLPVNFTL